jgi:hypothetical protein
MPTGFEVSPANTAGVATFILNAKRNSVFKANRALDVKTARKRFSEHTRVKKNIRVLRAQLQKANMDKRKLQCVVDKIFNGTRYMQLEILADVHNINGLGLESR